MKWTPIMTSTARKAFIITFCTMFCLSMAFIAVIETNRIGAETNRMHYFAASKSSKITESVVALLYKAEALSALVIQGNGSISNFERIAAIISNNPAIRNILIAPNGVVSHVYPPTEEKDLVGFNMLNPHQPGNTEAIMAHKTEHLTMGGPFNARQGGQVLVGRLPVFVPMTDNASQKVFWGLVSITLRYPEALLAVNLEDLDKMGYACEIWRISPETGQKQVILQTNSHIQLTNPVERSFNLLNARWTISLAPLVAWYATWTLYAQVFIALLISMLVAMMMQSYIETRKMKLILEEISMRDTLTGLPNRRYLFRKLYDTVKRNTSTGKAFAVAYLDLNGFREVNDTYGHHAGDLVLIEAAQRIKQCIGTNQLVARVGGDEFIVLIKHAQDEAKILKMFHNIENAFKVSILVDEQTLVTVEISIGVAFYPKNGSTVEELTAFADSAMYGNKHRFRTVARNDLGLNDMNEML